MIFAIIIILVIKGLNEVKSRIIRNNINALETTLSATYKIFSDFWLVEKYQSFGYLAQVPTIITNTEKLLKTDLENLDLKYYSAQQSLVNYIIETADIPHLTKFFIIAPLVLH